MTDHIGAALLRTFLESKRPLTQVAAARQLGIVPAALTAYLKGTQRPRSDIRQRIAKWSEGEVPESSWLTAEERTAVDGVDIAVIPDPPSHEVTNTENPSEPVEAESTHS